jgi:hypothetical protein
METRRMKCAEMLEKDKATDQKVVRVVKTDIPLGRPSSPEEQA